MPVTVNLGNDAFLTKIDQLRSTNVGELVPLPQVIVVGNQSSGKSSVLESLTGLELPRSASLCTRYATLVSCIKDTEPRAVASIIPRLNADDELKVKLQKFRMEIKTMDDMTEVFKKANSVMGIHNEGDGRKGLSAFSEDVLKIEIYGPEQIHLTLIDVPGIFELHEEGLTTKSDVQLVRNMVERYMKEERTIILAVVPSNVDIASQQILRIAREFDPDGLRTMGVLTKLDFVKERAMQEVVLKLLRGESNTLKLGYCAVRNRGADDRISNPAQRLEAERAFFQSAPWSALANEGLATLGTDALCVRLRDLLVDISRRALPKVRAEIEKQRRDLEDKLASLGPSRPDERTQRQYLVNIAVQFQNMKKSALYGLYTDGNDAIKFEHRPDLRLITWVTQLNEVFADTFRERGHMQHFHHTRNDKTETADSDSGDEAAGPEIYDDLKGILEPPYECPEPAPGPLTPLIAEVYQASLGPELGTFNGTVLAAVFAKLTVKWEQLALYHTSQAILLIHHFIRQLLEELCNSEKVASTVWDQVLYENLRDRYRAAMDHTRDLLKVEAQNPPMTLNRSFSSGVRRNRHKSDDQDLDFGFGFDTNNSTQVCTDLLDIVESYYEIARERFVDTLCLHVVYNRLLYGPDSPLNILSPDLILQMGADQLEAIAGEDAATKSQRQGLVRQLSSIDEALKVLRT